jgi:hypothetical protein
VKLPNEHLMDDELKIMHEAMVVKERLRVLAELQAAYWDELLARGFDQSIAEQLMMDWSRHAYGMTFRAMPDPSLDAGLDELLGGMGSSAVSAQSDGSGDPSRVPPGEPWLQLVQDIESDDDGGGDAASSDERAA